MNNLSYFSYSLSFLKRDTVVTLIHTVLYTVLFYFFIFSVFIQNIVHLANESNIQSIAIPQKNFYDLLNVSAKLSFLLCIMVLIFTTFIKILLKRNEIGIMMAVGGNRMASVTLVTMETLLSILPGFFLGLIAVSLYFPVKLPFAVDLWSILFTALKVFLYSATTTAVIIIPGTYIATMIDPYQFIKRQK